MKPFARGKPAELGEPVRVDKIRLDLMSDLVKLAPHAETSEQRRALRPERMNIFPRLGRRPLSGSATRQMDFMAGRRDGVRPAGDMR
jgi:hypothetical protein